MDLFKVTILLALGLFFCRAVAKNSADELLRKINEYRQKNKLSVLRTNDNAECLAEEMLDQFQNEKCTNTTGEDTVPGTEPQFQNYPQLLAKCHLNISDTRDGVILPDCVVDSNPDVAFINYTYPTSQYVQYVNSSTYVSAGVASEGNWFVVVLTTNTSGGSFQTYTGGQVKRSSFFWPFILLTLIGGLALSF